MKNGIVFGDTDLFHPVFSVPQSQWVNAHITCMTFTEFRSHYHIIQYVTLNNYEGFERESWKAEISKSVFRNVNMTNVKDILDFGIGALQYKITVFLRGELQV